MPLSVYYCALAGIIVGSTLTSAAQTNAPPRALQWLVVAAPHLRTESAQPAKSDIRPPPARPDSIATGTGPPDPPGPPPGKFAASTSREDSDYYLRNREFDLIRPPARPPDMLTRGFDSVFRPEEIRIGRNATFSCSMVTAIKRKNPLCLLNPIFLNLSW
jgi:hypothetical protein